MKIAAIFFADDFGYAECAGRCRSATYFFRRGLHLICANRFARHRPSRSPIPAHPITRRM